VLQARTYTRSAVLAAVCLALTAGVLTGAPADAAPTAPAAPAAPAPGVPHVNQVAAASQCPIGLGRPQKGSAARARALMAGHASLNEYGSFHLAADPRWKPVSTLDSSGKGYMHSLHYLLPLLRRGVKTGNKDFIDRFYFLIHDWYRDRDNKPGGSASRYAWGPPIYEGFRSLVFVCAAAGPRGNAPWLAKALKKQGEMAASSARYEGVNNASLHQQMGLYAVAVTLGRPAWRHLARQRIAALAARLIHPDGSDEEGALTYAQNDYRWFNQAAERFRRAGDTIPPEFARIDAIPAFLGQATRPDGRIEALGDSSPTLLGARNWSGTPAEWAATGGASGIPPSATFSAYAGGYVFGRSGWGSESRPLVDQTYYSVRAGQGSGIPHAHDDAGALTLYSYGSPLLLDTGQWKYVYGTTRSFVVSRAAHNAVLVDGVARTRPRPELRTAQAPGLDMTTVVDTGYQGVTLTRTIAYDRVDDVVLVWDRLDSAKEVRASQQWGLGRDRGVTLDQDTAHTTGDGANVSLFFTSGGSPLDVERGDRKPWRGWNSIAYGELSPAPSLRASQRGTSLSWLTVIAPRKPGVPGAAYAATSTVSGAAASVVLTTPTGSSQVNLDPTSGSLTPATTLTPAASAPEPIVLAGTSTDLRGSGLVPSAPVTLESMPVGTSTWSPVTSGVASQAGTIDLGPVPMPATADLRLVQGGTASTPVRVTAAVAPQPPTGVTATPTGQPTDGQVTVAWQPPVDTGGAPLTRYVVRIDGKRVVVPAGGATSVVVNGVHAGAEVAKVRAFNVVAMSSWAQLAVAVPPYPSITGPTKVRKGTKVRLRMSGLLPGQVADVAVKTVKSGAVRVLHPTATKDGTATVRFVVRSTTRVSVTSGGITSAVHRIGVPTRKHRH
jgi:hypothetical protein